MEDVIITRAGVEWVDDLEEVCRSLFEAVASAGPDVPGVPARDLDQTWERRRANYVEWLAEPGAFVVMAETDGRAVGYALVRTYEELDGWDSDGPLAELESLAVLPDHRARGIGKQLVGAVEAQLRGVGVRALLIGTGAGNHDAIRFFAGLGHTHWANQFLGRIPDEPR